MKRIIAFVKKETVLSISWILAIGSMFFVHPSVEYLNYIDYRSIGLLWSLMIIMAGLDAQGMFEALGIRILKKTKNVWQLSLVLVYLCFFSSMFITNDVALLTFVPFAMFILEACDQEERMIPVIALQTVAANLGSMLTPIGNPQNLYLYGISGMSIGQFIMLMLPYSLITAVLLFIAVAFIKNKSAAVVMQHNKLSGSKRLMGMYGVLFLISLTCVAKLLPYQALMLIVLIVVLIKDKNTLISIDYALLGTFIGFFIFVGNLGNLDAVSSFLEGIIAQNEVMTGIIASQFISNVPAALLLSGFATDIKGLIIGVNFGGLGTLIASMASLISFKLLAHNKNEMKGRYFIMFTAVNVLFLAVLVLAYMLR